MQAHNLMLPGYETGAVLWRTDGRVVFSARRLSDGYPVSIETLDTEYPDRQQIAALRREGEIGQRLNHIEGVRKVHAVLPFGSGNLALVGELVQNTLKTITTRLGEKCFSFAEVLDIGLRVVSALAGIHAQNVVHKSLMPEHVLFDTATSAVSLSGFGIASELDQERQAVRTSRCLEGPLPYISPEQTGRMNRDLDYRSDYYSLGVLLFELLTGRCPFLADNVLEWVHSHISRLPPSPLDLSPDLPKAVSDIILKLLSKEPEDRYQSAEGIIYDLEQCATLLDAGKTIAAFPLGEKDVVQKFLVSQHLYGRENELAQLVELFEGAVVGRTEVCLVHGHSGVGKSALVNEIDRPLVRERGFLVQGKFEQFQQGEAFTALASAYKGLVHQVLAEPETRLIQWKQKLQDVLHPNARLVVELVPELELIIGPQPDVAKLPPAEERNRLQILLTAFLGAFAGEGHPVVLLLDDLQWSDAPTLALLKRIVTYREMSHLLLIGSYRSNEVGAGHPLRLLLDDLETQKNICQLPLAPLDKISVRALVADTLCCEQAEAYSLSDMLFHKTQGNPFFINELLRQLYQEEVITLNKITGRWDWDLDIARWSQVSQNVVEFMVDNLRQLAPSTQSVLQLAACIGSTFDLKTLASIYEHSAVETAVALMPALKLHTIVPLDSDYRLVGDGSEWLGFNPVYRFQHDRVQQAAYALIDESRLENMHLSVGRLLLQHAGELIADEHLTDIVEHLNIGRSLIESEAERISLSELNIRTAIRARHSSAYDTAFDYLQIALELLSKEPWRTTPKLMRTLAAELQQCAYLTMRTEQADEWIEVMLLHAQTDLERGDILATRTRQYATLGKMDESILSAIQGLDALGIGFTENPTEADVLEERRLVEMNLCGRSVEELVDAPLVSDEAVLTALRLMMEIFPATFLSGSGHLFPYLILKAVNLSLRHGNCPESAFAYAAYGMLLCGELDEPKEGYQYGKVGLAINERLDDLTLRARVIYVYAMFVHHWSNHWSTLTPLFRRGIEAGYQSGDLLYLAYSAQDYVIWDPSLDLDEAYRLHAEKLKIVQECAYQDSLDSGTLFLQLQRNLLGLTDTPFTLSDAGFDEQKCLAGMRDRQFKTGIANYQIYSAEICFIHGNYDRALTFVKAQDQMIRSSMSLPQLVRFYIVSFLTYATHFPDMEVDEQVRIRERLETDLLHMQGLAENCTENFHHLQLLMQAELSVLDKAYDSALMLYDAAIDAARESRFLRDEATACERAARFLIALGRRRSAEGYLHAAHRIFDRWGAHRKVQILEQEFFFLRRSTADRYALSGETTGAALDLASIMKASRDISQEIQLETLLSTTINILLENAGAQWGCFVVKRDSEMRIEAAVTLPKQALGCSLPNHSFVHSSDGKAIALPVTLLSHVLHSGEAIVLHNASEDKSFLRDPYIQTCSPSSVLCVPVQRERFEGVLYMENNLATGVFTNERVEVIRLLAAQASVAIENARLYEQVQEHSRTLEDKVAERTARLKQLNEELQGLADRDGLTGVANRRRGDTYLAEVWGRLRREGKALSLVMLDVDHFKTFNDNYGHQSGDDCLISVAKVVEQNLLKPGDMVARYGGEEFMLILPDTHSQDAAIISEKVRHAVEMLAIEHAHSSASSVVTVSAGTATVIPSMDCGSEELLREADIALYRAKKMGRNQVQKAATLMR